MNASRFSELFQSLFVLCGLVSLLVSGCDQERGDRRIAQKITCVNNLKQIGLGIKIWAGDHHDNFPFNVSTNAGGTLEFCSAGKDGFDNNTYLHFKAMSGDECLSVPLLVVCPQDTARRAATNWASLRPENVTYRLRSGTSVSDSNPRQILAVCPVDGNILYCDGTVTDGK